MLYSICGLNIEFSPKYPLTLNRSRKYLAEDQAAVPDFSMNITEEQIDGYLKLYPHSDRDIAEHGLYALALFDNILDYDGFFLHSSAIAVDGKAYLFTADSGVGKSTHTSLWRKHFGERAVMINDDKPIVRIVNDEIFACGNPFSGKNDISSNIMVPLKSVCQICRGTDNSIHPLSHRQSIMLFLNQTVRINDPEKTAKLLSLLDKVLNTINVYSLQCDISLDAVMTAYKAMNGS